MVGITPWPGVMGVFCHPPPSTPGHPRPWCGQRPARRPAGPRWVHPVSPCASRWALGRPAWTGRLGRTLAARPRWTQRVRGPAGGAGLGPEPPSLPRGRRAGNCPPEGSPASVPLSVNWASMGNGFFCGCRGVKARPPQGLRLHETGSSDTDGQTEGPGGEGAEIGRSARGGPALPGPRREESRGPSPAHASILDPGL